jgi:hypothetical protein
MQAEPMKGLSAQQIDEMNEKYDGAINNLVPFDEEKMGTILKDKNIKSVRVMRLKLYDHLRIKGQLYRVTKLNHNKTGNIVLKPIEG